MVENLQEIWKKIKDFDDYEVSNLGNVKSLKNGNEKILRPNKDKDGYLLYTLCKNGNKKTFKGHYLVLSTFYPNHDKDKNEINHLK